jgi:hypothetical protein
VRDHVKRNLHTDMKCINHVPAYSSMFLTFWIPFYSFAGYFTFEECPGLKNPTIGMEYGMPYRFIQKDRSNWYHPIGFAYFPDGAHVDADELEPGITQTGSTCVADNTCPTPLYFRDGVFLGNPLDKSDFGLDVYEPDFFLGITTWSGSGEYSAMLIFDDEAYTDDIFYFCHVCSFVSELFDLMFGCNTNFQCKT